jgi:hypothetical protein
MFYNMKEKLSLSLVPISLIDAATMLLLVAVVGDTVSGATDVVADLGTALLSEALDKADDLVGAVELLETHKVGGETGNVRGGHAGTAESSSVSVGLDANAEDIDTRGVNVNLGAKVGEVGTLVGKAIDSTDSDSVGGRSRRSQGSSPVLVTSCHNRDNASLEKSFNGTVDSLRLVTTERHVHNSLASTVILLDIVNDELHALKDTRVAATTRGIENLDGNKVNLLGNTEGSATNGSSDVATVTVLIIILFS